MSFEKYPYKNRYFGTEIEFGLHAENPDGEVVTATALAGDEIPKEYTEFYSIWKEHSFDIMNDIGQEINEDGFSSQGGRVYLDMGTHLEVATPETSNPRDAVKYELAAELIGEKIMRSMKDRGLVEYFQIHKRSTDHEGHAWACHENISIGKGKFERKDIAFMASHVATRGIYAGAGGLIQKRGLNYYTSPRQDRAKSLSESGRVNPKPLVCNALDMDIDSMRYQQIGNEATLSPWSMFVRHSMNEVVVNLIEHDVKTEDLRLARPLTAAHVVANDTKVERPLQLWSGKTIRATELQKEIAIRALEFDRYENLLSTEAHKALIEVIKVCDELEIDIQKVSDRVEWVARQNYLRDKKDELRLSVNNDAVRRSELKRFDLAWDSLIGGEAVKKRRLENWGWGSLTPIKQSEILAATVTPPQDTRAAQRGRMVYDPTINVDQWQYYSTSSNIRRAIRPDGYSYELDGKR